MTIMFPVSTNLRGEQTCLERLPSESIGNVCSIQEGYRGFNNSLRLQDGRVQMLAERKQHRPNKVGVDNRPLGNQTVGDLGGIRRTSSI